MKTAIEAVCTDFDPYMEKILPEHITFMEFGPFKRSLTLADLHHAIEAMRLLRELLRAIQLEGHPDLDASEIAWLAHDREMRGEA